jgi:hypothetical protein
LVALSLTRRLSSALAAPPAMGELRALAGEYAQACEEANRRLGHCALLFDRGDLAGVQRLAAQTPRLVEFASALNWPERGRWQALAESRGLALPAPLRVDLLQRLQTVLKPTPPALPPTLPPLARPSRDSRVLEDGRRIALAVSAALAGLLLVILVWRFGSESAAATTTTPPVKHKDPVPAPFTPVSPASDEPDDLDFSEPETELLPEDWSPLVADESSDAKPEPSRPARSTVTPTDPAEPVVRSALFARYPEPERSLTLAPATVFGASPAEVTNGIIWRAAVPVPDVIDLISDDLELEAQGASRWQVHKKGVAVAGMSLVEREGERELQVAWADGVGRPLQQALQQSGLRMRWGRTSLLFLLVSPERRPALPLAAGFKANAVVETPYKEHYVTLAAAPGFVPRRQDVLESELDAAIRIHGSVNESSASVRVEASLEVELLGGIQSLSKYGSIATLRRRLLEVRSPLLDSLRDQLAVLADRWERDGLPAVTLTLFRRVPHRVTGRNVALPVIVFGDQPVTLEYLD